MKSGDKVNILGDVAEVIRLHGEKMVLVRFTGRTTEGKFSETSQRNLWVTVLKCVCQPLTR